MALLIVTITKSTFEKMEALIHSIKFLPAEFALYHYIYLSYSLPWNTVFISRMILLAATWIWTINYRNGHVGLLVLHLLSLLKPWLFVEI